MLQVGDTVKVIAPTMFNGKPSELFPIGTIGMVAAVGYGEDGIPFYEIRSASEYHSYAFYYLENELEKGHLEWVKD